VGEDFLDGEEEGGLREFLVGAEVGPDSVQPDIIAGLEPVGDLFDGGVFEIGRKLIVDG
jgi:hypothetical protein